MTVDEESVIQGTRRRAGTRTTMRELKMSLDLQAVVTTREIAKIIVGATMIGRAITKVRLSVEIVSEGVITTATEIATTETVTMTVGAIDTVIASRIGEMIDRVKMIVFV